MATRTPPALMDELVEEILVRIPPDDPARLVRASIACKRWCRLVCDPGFRRRFRERHRTPPLLGVIRYCHVRGRDRVARFVSTCSFRPRRADRHGWRAIDCRLGRVLLRSEPWSSRSVFAVWDPVTDAQRELPALPQSPSLYNSIHTNAAVLCAGRGGCNHLDCHSGPYLVSGGLGCVTEQRSALYQWSREAGPDRDMRWVQSKLIEYKIPVGRTMITLDVFGFADGSGVIYVGTDNGAFMTDLKSGRFMKVGGMLKKVCSQFRYHITL
ncbi:unnamed protein product [Miscanthus lutarioriparius]|uniref:F-box domain-containing protein n=1 Tax=Miscanthus lutarioriparius TaxID=422564 RepID=A0A811NB40_9POAL|nr:unnamed protein product [Miscanthus lutarioriparius]